MSCPLQAKIDPVLASKCACPVCYCKGLAATMEALQHNSLEEYIMGVHIYI